MFSTLTFICLTRLTVALMRHEEAWQRSPCHWYLKRDTSREDHCECQGHRCGNDELTLGGSGDDKLFNVIFNKPSAIAHRWTCGRKFNCRVSGSLEFYCYCYGTTNLPCVVNNGVTSNQLRSPGWDEHECDRNGGLRNKGTACILGPNGEYPPVDCAHTDSTYSRAPFWYVDLGRQHTISQVFWVLQEGQTFTEKYDEETRSIMYTRWRGLVVLVDGKVCARWYDQSTPERQLYNMYAYKQNMAFYLTCYAPIRGKYLRFQKTPDPSGSTSSATLQVCEIQSYVCQADYYISGNHKLIGYNNDTFKKINFPVCTLCPSTDTCLYGCDNFYGCLSERVMSYNLAIMAEQTFASSGRDPGRAVDGVSHIHRPDFCFETLQKSGADAHYWRAYIPDLSSIHNVTVTGNSVLDPRVADSRVRDLVIRVAREITIPSRITQDGDEICAQYNGNLPPHYPEVELSCETCVDFANKPTGCPQGQYVTVGVSPFLTVMRLCEVQIWGTPQRDIAVGGQCAELTCELFSCQRPSECHAGICKNRPGRPCTVQNHCLPDEKTVCYQGICKWNLNVDCRTEPAHCVPPYICSEAFLCKVALRGICTVDNDCVPTIPGVDGSSVVCDFFHTCKLTEGSPCSENGVCQAGSSCTNGRCSDCNNKGVTTKLTGSKCSPIHYGKECFSDNDCDQIYGPACNLKDNNCDCGAGTSPSQLDFSCGPAPGSQCVSDESCKGVLSCIQGLCKIAHMGSCRGSGAAHCGEGNCDPQTEICKKTLLQECTTDEDCTSGLVCAPAQQNSFKCKATLGSTCTQGSDECGDRIDSLACSPKLGTCVLTEGSLCNPARNRKCMDDLACEMTLEGVNKCIIPLGGSCVQGDSAKHCAVNTVCDTEGKCSLELGRGCSQPWTRKEVGGIEECGPDGICDVDFTCKWKAGANCTNEAHCTAGAFCDPEIKKCSCSSEMTLNKTVGSCVQTAACSAEKLCLVGSPCSEANKKCVDKAECSELLKTCVCAAGFSATEHATCLPSPSEKCALTEEEKKKVDENIQPKLDGNPTVRRSALLPMTLEGSSNVPLCAPGLVCDEGNENCGIKTGYICFPEHPSKSYCQRGTVCDGGKCRLKLNADCKAHNTLCKTGLVCSVYGTCRSPVSKVGNVQPDLCYSDDQCVIGAVCNIKEEADQSGNCSCNENVAAIDPKDGQCYPKPDTLGGLCPTSTCKVENSECRKAHDGSNRCLCKEGFDEEETSMTCKTGPGVTCTSDNQCVAGTACDGGFCKVDIGQQCTGFGSGVCRSEAVCEEPGICRVKARGSCKDLDPTLCAVGTICDPIFECRRSPGAVCKEESDCTAGAQCENGKCKCNTNVAVEYFGLCRPKVGKVGQNCDKTEDCPSLSVCKDEKCFCHTSATLNRKDLTCEKTGKSDEDESGLSPNFLAAVLGLIAALLVILLCIILRRKKSKKEKTTGVEEELHGRMKDLKKMQEDLPPPEREDLKKMQEDLPPPERRIQVRSFRAKEAHKVLGTEVDPESYLESMDDPNQ